MDEHMKQLLAGNRALATENQQLKQQLAHQEIIRGQRGMAVVDQFIDGLRAANQAAAMGDPGSQALLKALHDLLTQSRVAAAGILVPASAGPNPNGSA
jgi:chitinase